MILGSEINEFVTNRQNSKIQFLQAENNQLQEDIKDLEQALKLNKEALKLAYQQKKIQNNQQNNVSNINNQTINYQDIDNQNKLFEKLYQENKQLLETLERITKERNQAQSKVLIQEQVNEENINFQKDIIKELEDKVQELRVIIHDKEYTVQELEKNHTSSVKDIAIKIREIITPNEQSIKLYSEIENQKYNIKKINVENQKLDTSMQKLKDYNRKLKREIIKLKVAIKNKISFRKMKEFVINDRLQNGDEDLFLNKEYINDYYQDKQKDRINKNQQQCIGNYYNNSKIKPKQQLIDDITKLQLQLRNFKILFYREMQNSNLINKQLDNLQKFQYQLVLTNETIFDSNKLNQEKQDKMKQEIDYYKQYYYKFIDNIKNRKRNNSNSSFIIENKPQYIYKNNIKKILLEILLKINILTTKKFLLFLLQINNNKIYKHPLYVLDKWYLLLVLFNKHAKMMKFLQ
ncbi:hypothetical protein IMG5_054430 [Ichthyophthirius multifiliis]|uniref:Uncharacterized protein n=1 Tax=Ichthyophthirius multifiliis TaxID=5932 RepID=G0QN08_ICHMU|nr:hypothetical protein IMG5_054430 [Ichthyophthirius multifiliis]EGR33398.1 hypothetical protein IMG5_054430 [Ichthyophthirius multifiliis]|eukprot:XP_004037384.1 hypothetical protein IMG5_054430 [Ichthyophthirius multifiliis]